MSNSSSTSNSYSSGKEDSGSTTSGSRGVGLSMSVFMDDSARGIESSLYNQVEESLNGTLFETSEAGIMLNESLQHSDDESVSSVPDLKDRDDELSDDEDGSDKESDRESDDVEEISFGGNITLPIQIETPHDCNFSKSPISKRNKVTT